MSFFGLLLLIKHYPVFVLNPKVLHLLHVFPYLLGSKKNRNSYFLLSWLLTGSCLVRKSMDKQDPVEKVVYQSLARWTCKTLELKSKRSSSFKRLVKSLLL